MDNKRNRKILLEKIAQRNWLKREQGVKPADVTFPPAITNGIPQPKTQSDRIDLYKSISALPPP